MTKATKKAFSMHKAMMAIAKEQVAKHIVEEDGERCFNLFTYMESLEARLDTILADTSMPHGKWHLDGHEVARYLWACLALEEGEQVYGNTFRGMPVLD